MPSRESLRFVVIPATLIAIGCSKGVESRRDTAAAPPAIGGANANPVDTGMAARTPDSATMRHDRSHAAVKKP